MSKKLGDGDVAAVRNAGLILRHRIVQADLSFLDELKDDGTGDVLVLLPICMTVDGEGSVVPMRRVPK
jgi:hypothetical protein